MDIIKIRQIIIDDLVELQKVAQQTFFEAFAAKNTEANMKNYLEQVLSAKKLRDELSNQNSEFYFAQCNDRIVGYLKVNFGQAQSDLKDEHALEIERIYVLKEFYGKKVGQLLYEKALELAKQKQVDYLWLGVWEENPRAIKFYEKNGFSTFDKHVFRLGNDEQTDLLMKLPIH